MLREGRDEQRDECRAHTADRQEEEKQALAEERDALLEETAILRRMPAHGR